MREKKKVILAQMAPKVELRLLCGGIISWMQH